MRHLTRGSSASQRAWRALAGALLLVACKKAPPPPTATSAPSAPVAAAASASSAVVASAAPMASPPPPAKPPAPEPTVLDAEGQRVAKAYLAALAKGRKATVAKDYVLAEAQFSKCLELLPKDPRALAERGYARLLADKLADAQADLTAAHDKAPNAALAQQIAHNLMLVARKSGDEAQALRWEAEKKTLKAARRLPGGVECTVDVGDSALPDPTVVDSFDAALRVVRQAHAKAVEVDEQTIEHQSPEGDESYPAQLQALKAQQPFPDGAKVVWTSGGGYQNHGVIAQGGKLFVFPSLSTGNYSLCGLDSLAEVTIEGGGATPWRIQRVYREVMRAYICEQEDGTMGPNCREDAPTMGSCAWIQTHAVVTLLDAKTFRGLRSLSVWARPSDDARNIVEPARLLDLDWQPDHVLLEACGQRQKVPYVEP